MQKNTLKWRPRRLTSGGSRPMLNPSEVNSNFVNVPEIFSLFINFHFRPPLSSFSSNGVAWELVMTLLSSWLLIEFLSKLIVTIITSKQRNVFTRQPCKWTLCFEWDQYNTLRGFQTLFLSACVRCPEYFQYRRNHIRICRLLCLEQLR